MGSERNLVFIPKIQAGYDRIGDMARKIHLMLTSISIFRKLEGREYDLSAAVFLFLYSNLSKFHLILRK